MNTKMIAAVAAAAVMGLSGCADMSPHERQTAGTVGGAVVGGVVGNAVLGGPVGAIGGAAAGAYIGNKATEPEHRR